MRFHCIFGLVLLAVTASSTRGQTTQPAAAAPAPWPAAVERFAQALAAGEPAALKPLLTEPSVIVRRFGGEEKEDVAQVVRRVAGGQVLGSHGYVFPPLVMAADIAADFKTAPDVPDAVKQQMVPTDDEQMKRANATAVQWVAASLDASANEKVGVIVLWCPRPTVPGMVPGVSTSAEPVFVLVKGQEVSPDHFRVRQIVYGNPVGSN